MDRKYKESHLSYTLTFVNQLPRDQRGNGPGATSLSPRLAALQQPELRIPKPWDPELVNRRAERSGDLSS